MSDDSNYYSSFGGRQGTSNNQFNFPNGLTVGSDDKIYVADTYNNRIQILTQSGSTLGYYTTYGGTEGSGNNQFKFLSDIAITPNGKILALDGGNNRIQILTQSGINIGYQSTIQLNETTGSFYFCLGENNKIYVSFGDNNKINVYAQKNLQSITFAPIPTKTYGNAPFALTATATSGLPVGFSVSGPAFVTGNMLTITGVGVVTVTAFQSGDASYAAAPSVVQTFKVFEPQTITFPPIPNKTYGDAPFALNATATSGLQVSFSVSGSAFISGNMLTITGAGLVTVKAFQNGNGTYAGVFIQQTFLVNKASQTISFDPLSSHNYYNRLPAVYCRSSPFEIKASSTSKLPLSFTSSNSTIGSINASNNTINILNLGVSTVTAFQAGDINYLPAAL